MASTAVSEFRSTGISRAHHPAIVYWSMLGALALIVTVYIWGSWIFSPDFKTVPVGPSAPPAWMKLALITMQGGMAALALVVLYTLVVRPWRRQRQIGIYGIIALACCVLWVQDPSLSYINHYFSYNTYLVNFGTWASKIPGWNSYGSPGHGLAQPVLLLGPAYIVTFPFATWAGCWILRRTAARWPRLSVPALLAITLPCAMLVTFALEGLFFMPLGAWQYGGGHLSLFPDAYHKYPLLQAVSTGSCVTAWAGLCFFTNEKGETLVERGINNMRLGVKRKVFLRVLAILAAFHVIMLVTYQLPTSLVLAPNSDPWPADTQSRSYFTSGICGAGTDRICPQPGIPISRGSDSVHISPDGHLVIPKDSAAAKIFGLAPGESRSIPIGNVPVIPFTDGGGPFTGRLFGRTG